MIAAGVVVSPGQRGKRWGLVVEARQEWRARRGSEWGVVRAGVEQTPAEGEQHGQVCELSGGLGARARRLAGEVADLAAPELVEDRGEPHDGIARLGRPRVRRDVKEYEAQAGRRPLMAAPEDAVLEAIGVGVGHAR